MKKVITLTIFDILYNIFVFFNFIIISDSGDIYENQFINKRVKETLTMESWIQGEQPKEPQLNSTNNIDVDRIEPNQSSGNQTQSLSIREKLLHDVERICMISA